MPVHGCCAASPPRRHALLCCTPSCVCQPMAVNDFLDKGVGGAQLPRKRCVTFSACWCCCYCRCCIRQWMATFSFPPGNPCWVPHACWLPDLQRPLINPFGDPCVSLLPRRQDRKDKEKEKRIRGQSTHAQWKSEVGGTALVGGRQLEAADTQCGLQVHPTRCTPCPCSLHPTAAGGDGAAPAVRLRGRGSARLCPGAASCAANRSVLFWKPFVTCKSVAAVWALTTHRSRQQRAFCGSARQA